MHTAQHISIMLAWADLSCSNCAIHGRAPGSPFRRRPSESGGAPLPSLQAHFILPHLNESAIFLSFHLQNASDAEGEREGGGGGERGRR